MTFTKLKTLYHTYAYNCLSDVAATFNGVSCTNATGASLSARHYFLGCVTTNNTNNSFEISFNLPDDYIAGDDIGVKFYFTYSSGAGGTMNMNCGLTRDATVMGGEAQTTYMQHDYTADISSWQIKTYEFVFTGTNFLPGDPIAVVFFRDTRAASSDDLAVTVYFNQICVLVR